MKWKFWIQEKLFCTSQELSILLGIVAIILTSHGIQIYKANILPFDDAYYAETDSLFQLLAARADSLDAVDTLFTSKPSYSNLTARHSLTSYSGMDPIGISKSDKDNSEPNRLMRPVELNGSGYDQNQELQPLIAEISRWIVRDTLEKPLVSFPINLIVATEAELQALPRIGPQMAKRIVAFRKETPFTSVEDLLMVRGIGPKTMDQLRDLVTLGDSTTILQVDSLRH